MANICNTNWKGQRLNQVKFNFISQKLNQLLLNSVLTHQRKILKYLQTNICNTKPKGQRLININCKRAKIVQPAVMCYTLYTGYIHT